VLPLGVEGELGDELVELGLELVDELPDLSVVLELELEPVVVDGDVPVDGDADGGVPLGVRSPVRSVRDSLQAVSRPRLSATAKTAVSILFISTPPPCGLRDQRREVATAMPVPVGLTGNGRTITNAE
jgi:hypothetical protein